MSALRSCLICLASFLVQFVVFGVCTNFGLIYYHLRREFNGSKVETALIGSFGTGLIFLISPVSNIILIKYGSGIHIVVSTLLCVVSWLTSSFVTTQNTLIFTYSVLWGCGAGFANHASLVLIQKTFTRRLSLANGIITSGSGIGTLILGPLLELLIQKYGLSWTFRICALLPLLFLVSVIATYCSKQKLLNNNDDNNHSPGNRKNSGRVSTQDIVNEIEILSETEGILSNELQLDNNTNFDNNDNQNDNINGNMINNERQCTVNWPFGKSFMSAIKDIFDKDLLNNKSLMVYTAGMSTFLFGYFIPFTFLVDYATQQGIVVTKAQFLIGTLSIASIVTKIVFGAIMDSQKLVRRSTGMIITLYTMAMSMLIIPFATEYWHFLCFSLVFGSCEGFMVGQICTVVVDLISQKEKVGAAIGNLFASMSIAVISGPVVAGGLSTAFDSSKTPFYVACVVSLIGATITACVKLFEKDFSKRQVDVDKTSSVV